MIALVRNESNLETTKSSKAMDRIFNEAPYLPRCSTNKTAALVRPLEYAVNYPYMQINRSHMVSWLIFDLDHDHLVQPNPYIWSDKGLPAPNFIVRDKKSNKAHLFYAISPVCTSENARSKPIQYMKAVYRAMALCLESDLDYSGPVAKTPHHSDWLTTELHGQEYSLDELSDYVELESSPPPWAIKEQIDTSHSRNCSLFEKLRYYAYGIVNQEREKGSFRNFSSRLSAYANSNNDFVSLGFDSNLSASEVKATVKSICRWTWDNYRGRSDCQRGIMALSDSLSLSEKQALAAKRTHRTRQQKSLISITKACRWLKEQNKAPTFSAIAHYARLSRQTVAKYAIDIARILKAPTSVIPLESLFNNKLSVNHAVHQISGSSESKAFESVCSLNSSDIVSSLVERASCKSIIKD